MQEQKSPAAAAIEQWQGECPGKVIFVAIDPGFIAAGVKKGAAGDHARPGAEGQS